MRCTLPAGGEAGKAAQGALSAPAPRGRRAHHPQIEANSFCKVSENRGRNLCLVSFIFQRQQDGANHTFDVVHHLVVVF
jgi:hypothetical protein